MVLPKKRGNIMENYQPPFKRPRYFLRSVARENQQQLNLTDINPRCIFKIFDHLDIIDLSMIADTNKKLRTLAQDHFRVKCGNFDIHTIFQRCSKNNPQAAKIFRNFGQFISDLSICGGCATKRIFKLIKKYCNANKLTRLRLKYMIINKFNMKNLAPFFGNLEFLQISECEMKNLIAFPDTFKRLKSLELAKYLEDSFIEQVIRHKFPQLERFSVGSQCEVNHIDFCAFILRHPNLKALSFDDDIIFGETIEFIGKTLTRLEHFVLKGDMEMNDADFRQTIMPFGSIKTLKKLILDCNNFAVENLFETFAANNIGLEHLHLININLNGKTQMHLKNLRTIRTLIFEKIDHENAQRYISIAECLPLLSEFHLVRPGAVSDASFKSLLFKSSKLSVLKIETSEFTINSQVYSYILNIIKNRPKAFGLEIRLIKGSGRIDVPKDKLKANEKWIRFVELVPSKTYDDDYDEKSDVDSHEESESNGEFYVNNFN